MEYVQVENLFFCHPVLSLKWFKYVADNRVFVTP